uniref:Ladderlectin-like n=1 Tax=Labrus bergylta TaxID=56723 RepID=A0A3Q3GB21_9LABR|nr:ladderlectin-like isoform X1 [Labrus bergylta]
MKMLTVLLLVCAATALTDAAEADVMAEDCPSGWTQYSGRCFLYVPTAMRWGEAERNCQSQGGNLASVHSYNEYHFIQGMITSQTREYPETWIGGSDALERTWLWSDGSYFIFSNWCRGQPDNLFNQDCLLMNFTGKSSKTFGLTLQVVLMK